MDMHLLPPPSHLPLTIVILIMTVAPQLKAFALDAPAAAHTSLARDT
jgi:hypothetical protein